MFHVQCNVKYKKQCEGIPGGPSGGQKPKLFGYNVVFEPGATQSDVLEYSGIKRIIEMAIEGFSCTGKLLDYHLCIETKKNITKKRE